MMRGFRFAGVGGDAAAEGREPPPLDAPTRRRLFDLVWRRIARICGTVWSSIFILKTRLIGLEKNRRGQPPKGKQRRPPAAKTGGRRLLSSTWIERMTSMVKAPSCGVVLFDRRPSGLAPDAALLPLHQPQRWSDCVPVAWRLGTKPWKFCLAWR